MADKNHEQYLEQIEKAVAETTMDILEEHSGDLREMAKLVAEKQVEINRLKEYHSEERKTIRNLRKLLKECNSERECNSHDVRQLENTREAVRKALGVEPDPTADALVKKIEELLKAACECRRMADDYDNVSLAAQLRKEENDELKKEIEKLKQEIRRSDHDACSHLRQIVELKKELKKWQDERLEFGFKTMGWKDEIDTILYGDKDGCPSNCWLERIADIRKLKLKSV